MVVVGPLSIDSTIHICNTPDFSSNDKSDKEFKPLNSYVIKGYGPVLCAGWVQLNKTVVTGHMGGTIVFSNPEV